MKQPRLVRLNSLLKEVISEVLRTECHHDNISPMTIITKVDITPDLHYAKVYVSVLGSNELRETNLKNLKAAAHSIRMRASKKVRLRYFPALNFLLDLGVDDHMIVEEALKEIEKERQLHPRHDD